MYVEIYIFNQIIFDNLVHVYNREYYYIYINQNLHLIIKQHYLIRCAVILTIMY